MKSFVLVGFLLVFTCLVSSCDPISRTQLTATRAPEAGTRIYIQSEKPNLEIIAIFLREKGFSNQSQKPEGTNIWATKSVSNGRGGQTIISAFISGSGKHVFIDFTERFRFSPTDEHLRLVAALEEFLTNAGFKVTKKS